jgi:hypothetical protein
VGQTDRPVRQYYTLHLHGHFKSCTSGSGLSGFLHLIHSWGTAWCGRFVQQRHLLRLVGGVLVVPSSVLAAECREGRCLLCCLRSVRMVSDNIYSSARPSVLVG